MFHTSLCTIQSKKFCDDFHFLVHGDDVIMPSGAKSASASLSVIAVALLCGSCSHQKPWRRSNMAFKQQYAKSLDMVVQMASM